MCCFSFNNINPRGKVPTLSPKSSSNILEHPLHQIDDFSRMAYVDHAFSISDEDMMFETSYAVNNKPPIKEIALAVSLLVVGAVGIVVGIIMASYRVGGDQAHGVFFAILGSILFIPGFYYTRIAYYAYKGYQGFSFSNIPPV